jgi:PAS domain S-box-containing protein
MQAAPTDPTADRVPAMLVDAMAEAVILADPDGVIRLWNRGAQAMFGFSAGEAVGSPLDLIIPDKLLAAHNSGFRAAVQTGQLKLGGRVMTTRARHQSGARVYVDFSFGMLRDDAGALVGIFAVGRDVTQRHLAQAGAPSQAGG